MIFLGLGSNLSSSFGDRFENINLALKMLQSKKIKILKKSSFYETPSYPDKSKPKYSNIVVSIKTKLSPIELMTVLIFIEKKLGRTRKKKNDPRTCDIDIIDYKRKILEFKHDSGKVNIPHKKISKRNFVLYPLKELCTNWNHPVTEEEIGYLINNLNKQDKMSILKV